MPRNLGKKEKMELAITGIGVIFLIFLVMGNAQNIRVKKKSMDKTNKAITYSLSAPLSFDTAGAEESRIKEGWGRDPFSLAASSAGGAGLEGLVLNGIMWDKENPYAIINGDVLKVGDALDNLRVIEITEQEVILEQNGERHTLKLPAY